MAMLATTKCPRCFGRWVCEQHPDRPFRSRPLHQRERPVPDVQRATGATAAKREGNVVTAKRTCPI
jgi:hypothetical protein